MKKTLYIKFLLGYLVFGVLSFVLISTFSAHLVHRQTVHEHAMRLYEEAVNLAGDYSSLYNGQEGDEEAAGKSLMTAAEALDGQIWIADRSGRLVFATDGQTGQIDGFDPAAEKDGFYETGSFYGRFDEPVVSVLAPITGNYSTYGYVIIHENLEKIQNEAYRLLNVLYISVGLVFVLSLIILAVFAKTVYLPLMKIAGGADRFAKGDLKYRIRVDTRDEMGYLAATLNYMSQELGKLEDYQKTFVANVSHDFRSPLTSINGYLTAMLDGTIPPDMHEKYIHRVLDETERLTKLTSGLLTLNTLDAKGLLSRTEFDINRVIKDVAASFEGTCMKKDSAFELTFSADEQPVYADISGIQQVLYNLIDNAIKFSGKSSTIYIKAEDLGERVQVSVKDTGCGIPKESQSKIWERFYKTDSSRGRDKKGTGLGLSIVKEVIRAHGETIDVISTEGAGSEFIFTLPKAGKKGGT